MTTLEAIGIFVGIPLVVFLVIAVAVSMPSLINDGRYRPGMRWEADPVWFNGPDDGRRRSGGAGRVGGAGGSW